MEDMLIRRWFRKLPLPFIGGVLFTIAVEMFYGEIIRMLEQLGISLPSLLLSLAENPLLIFAIVFGIPALWQFVIVVSRPDWYGVEFLHWNPVAQGEWVGGITVVNPENNQAIEECTAEFYAVRFSEIHSGNPIGKMIFKNDLFPFSAFWIRDGNENISPVRIASGNEAFVGIVHKFIHSGGHYFNLRGARLFQNAFGQDIYVYLRVNGKMNNKNLPPQKLQVKVVVQKNKNDEDYPEVLHVKKI